MLKDKFAWLFHLTYLHGNVYIWWEILTCKISIIVDTCSWPSLALNMSLFYEPCKRWMDSLETVIHSSDDSYLFQLITNSIVIKALNIWGICLINSQRSSAICSKFFNGATFLPSRRSRVSSLSGMVSRFVHHTGPDWNISTIIGWSAVKLCTDIHIQTYLLTYPVKIFQHLLGKQFYIDIHGFHSCTIMILGIPWLFLFLLYEVDICGFEWNILTTIAWIVMTLGVHSCLHQDCNNFGDTDFSFSAIIRSKFQLVQ